MIDIGLNMDVFNELKDIDLSDISIEWYDHHVWDEEWIKDVRYKNIDLYIDRSICATGVIAKKVCLDQNDRVNKLVRIVCDADTWRFTSYESTFLFRYADLENKDHWRNNVFKVIKNYLESTIKDIIQYIEEDVSRYVDEELKTLSLLRSKIMEDKIDEVKLCIYVKDHYIPSSSIIGNAMLSFCDIAVVVHETLKSISFRSRKCNVREIANIFGGGGHPKAAGAPLNIPLVVKLLNNFGLGVANKYVIDEISRKIRKSKLNLRSLCSEE
ncbi:MAG: DHHA1 domain-containing protein [Ignisphaera sp.]